jgi:hypothetical protein
MKNILKTLALFCILSIQSKAQIANISNEKMNVFYLGVSNPITIVSEMDYDSIKIDNGLIEWDTLNKFYVTLSKQSDATISLLKNNKIIYNKLFRVLNLPMPELKIAGKFSPEVIKKNELMTISGIVVEILGFDLHVDHKIDSWQISTVVNGNLKSVSGVGKEYSTEARQIFKECDLGEKIFFEIKCLRPDGRTIMLSHSVTLIQ